MKIPLVKISWDVNVSKFAPIGISSGIDVGFSNWGLELVNVSLYVLYKLNILFGLFINSFKLFYIVGTQ